MKKKNIRMLKLRHNNCLLKELDLASCIFCSQCLHGHNNLPFLPTPYSLSNCPKIANPKMSDKSKKSQQSKQSTTLSDIYVVLVTALFTFMKYIT